MSLSLPAIRDRLDALGLFFSVDDTAGVGEAMATFQVTPPAAFVYTSAERAQPNVMATAFRQRIFQTIGVMIVVAAERADRRLPDQVEELRLAARDSLFGWKPEGADSPLQFVSYSIRAFDSGLCWGELLFSAPYHLERQP